MNVRPNWYVLSSTKIPELCSRITTPRPEKHANGNFTERELFLKLIDQESLVVLLEAASVVDNADNCGWLGGDLGGVENFRGFGSARMARPAFGENFLNEYVQLACGYASLRLLQELFGELDSAFEIDPFRCRCHTDRGVGKFREGF